MADTPSWQDLLELVEQLNGSDYEQASVQFGDVSVRLSKSADAVLAERAERVEVAVPAERAERVEASRAAGPTIDAPMVGVFYRRPAPGAEPFVQPGDRVEPDTTIGIIEIMKLMNPISAGVSGVIADFLVNDGAAVEFGQALASLQPGE